MEWLWLILAVAGLVGLWFLIMGMDKLAQRLRAHDEARKIATQDIAERTAEAELDFLEKQYAKARAKDLIENGDFSDLNDPDQQADFQQALDTLSSEEFIQSVNKRAFGSPESTDDITATHSAFDQSLAKKVVASGEGFTPVKVKASSKPALSKSEQKMLKKIKQGY